MTQNEALAAHNVYIFSFIKNNEKNIELLKNTFAAKNCFTKVCEHFNYAQMKEQVELIRTSNFTLYDYIVIVVLDYENTKADVLSIANENGVKFKINGDLLNEIQKNPKLGNKKRLFVIQTNQNEDLDNHVQLLPETPNEENVLYEGPTVYFYATEWCELDPDADKSNFIKSFCLHFKENGINIEQVFAKLRADLQKKGEYPRISRPASYMLESDKIFGMALDNSTKRDFCSS